MESTEILSNDGQAATAPLKDKRPYVSPRLELLGRMSDLTASGSKPGKENRGNTAGNRP